MESTRIIATIYRTDAEQIARDGERARGPENFGDASEAQVRGDCERFAARNNIKNPRIEITIAERGEA